MGYAKALHRSGSVRVAAKGDRFRVIWTEDSVQKERTAVSLSEAIELCEEENTRLTAGQPDHRLATVADLVEGFVAAGLAGEFRTPWSDSQEEQMRSLLGGHVVSAEGAGLGPRRCGKLTRKDSVDVMEKMSAAGYAPTTIKHVAKAGRRLVAFGLQLGVFSPEKARQLQLGFRVPEAVTIAEVSAAAASGAQVVDVPTSQQVNSFIEAMREADPGYGLLTELSASTGLRWEEAVALRHDDIDVDAGTVSVRRARKRKKGGTFVGLPKTRSSVRTVRLTDSVLEQLEMLVDKATPHNWLFTTSRGDEGKPISSSSSFRKSWWLPAAVSSGYTPFVWHDLRHYYATRQLQAGVPIANLSRSLGHSSVRVTLDVYVGTDADALETSVASWM